MSTDKKKRNSIDKIRKGSSTMSAQLQKTARRVSTVLAPQLTKMDPIQCLQHHSNVMIKIDDFKKMERAMENYILHNVTNFEPILFSVVPVGQTSPILSAHLSADELFLMEGTKKLVSIVFSDHNIPGEGPASAKIRHHMSGMKMYEIVDLAHDGNWQIMASTEESCRIQFESMTSFFQQLMSLCGLTFVPNRWISKHQVFELGQIRPQNSMFKENAMLLSWKSDVENEMRVLMLCFALFQTVREGYPQILKIVTEYRRKKSASIFP